MWETLLLEAGFLAVFLGSAEVAPLLPAVLALRWLLFRLEVGAGLIKLRNDPAWRDLTALYHRPDGGDLAELVGGESSMVWRTSASVFMANGPVQATPVVARPAPGRYRRADGPAQAPTMRTSPPSLAGAASAVLANAVACWGPTT